MKSSFLLYTDYMEHIQLLDMEERGVLLTAIFQYAATGEVIQMDSVTAMAFSFIKMQLDRDSEKYTEVVEKRRESGKAGGLAKARNAKANLANAKFATPNVAKPSNAKQSLANLADNDTDNDNDIERENIKEKEQVPKPAKRFSKPTVEQVAEYCKERGNRVDAQAFVDHYESNGWLVGKSPMKDWKAAVRTWEKNDIGKPKKNAFDNFEQSTTDYDTLMKEQVRQRLKGGGE